MTTREIDKALKRLAANNTYLKRRNALRAFDHAVRALQAEVAEEYPKLRGDGTAIKPRKKRKGAFCPVCRTPMGSCGILAYHLRSVEHYRYATCFCGKQFKSTGQLTRHLAATKDLLLHFGMARLKQSAGVK